MIFFKSVFILYLKNKNIANLFAIMKHPARQANEKAWPIMSLLFSEKFALILTKKLPFYACKSYQTNA